MRLNSGLLALPLTVLALSGGLFLVYLAMRAILTSWPGARGLADAPLVADPQPLIEQWRPDIPHSVASEGAETVPESALRPSVQAAYEATPAAPLRSVRPPPGTSAPPSPALPPPAVTAARSSSAQRAHWPHPDGDGQASEPLRTCSPRVYDNPDRSFRNVQNIVRVRNRTQASWYRTGSCEAWKLEGEWRPRDRRVYYATLVDSELHILMVLLEEIYPVVDVIILQESKLSWRYQAKRTWFKEYNQSHFQKYADKIRYMEYDFDDIKRVTKGWCPGGEAGEGGFAGMLDGTLQHRFCPWFQQWQSRNNLASAAWDMRPHDLFILADLDEIMSREFITAMRHCSVLPEAEPADAPCKKLVTLTFGHKYNFDCSVLKPAGHFHPDVTLGRCVPEYTLEELRLEWGDMDPAKPAYYQHLPKKWTYRVHHLPPGFVKPTVVGPVGWHMHSFASTAHVLYKMFSRAGRYQFQLTSKMEREAIEWRKDCNERPDFFQLDAWVCQPLPHAVRENPHAWQHLLRYVPDSDLPDEFGSLQHVQGVLARIRASNILLRSQYSS